ncbi:sulfite exporter TauE/SafE family protein [Melioribacter sp. OK-6-Me]|uniref:sulfite exporter TauE/SafE family protein n=1 Tax=unclassified Melioribacter TaxID=2627329 RepID=UPI003EDA2D1B
MEIWTGLLIGLFGSLHCVGMCGPIVMAIPIVGETWIKIFSGRLLYNAGRITTYTLMGLLFGLFGKQLQLIGLQQYISLISGGVILIYLFLPSSMKNKVAHTRLSIMFYDRLKIYFGKLISRKTIISLYLIGILNGLLPCGFVYVGIAGALTMSTPLEGAIYMALFGLGTFPVMFITATLGNFIHIKLRKKLIPAMAFLLALLFILRGMNLGIPFLSPKIKNVVHVEMHH